MGLAAVGLAATVAATAISAYGEVKQGQATAAAAEYNAQVAKNAALYEQQAGQAEVQAAQRRTAALEGRQKAGFAAQGVDVNFGSPLDIQSDTARLGALDAQTVRSNAARRAYGYSAEAGLLDTEASQAKTAGWTSAAGTLIGGAGSVASKWDQYQMAGVDTSGTAGLFS